MVKSKTPLKIAALIWTIYSVLLMLLFGGFSVLHDPSTFEPDSVSLLRVGIGARKLGSGSLFLYGLIMRKHVVVLAAIEGDEQRLSTMYRDFGTKLVGLDSLGDAGESLISRIKAAARK